MLRCAERIKALGGLPAITAWESTRLSSAFRSGAFPSSLLPASSTRFSKRAFGSAIAPI
ncbi:hypothetical protein D8I24_3462 (plasmid) [Cupriavidus necator H850]|uniref:hypothetical protein n=1 Tax=Cupriavidus necator TaxID=106590 RepID=UPI003FA49FED|nr:hypothetical protein D8I24_3462 [Cupriavidus necator H850]